MQSLNGRNLTIEEVCSKTFTHPYSGIRSVERTLRGICVHS